MEHDANKRLQFYLCVMGAFTGSVLFCLVSSGMWASGFWLLAAILSFATCFWLYRTVTGWKRAEPETKSLLLLLAALLAEYWLWLFFASYPSRNSYGFLVGLELLRFLVLLFIFRYMFGFGGITSAWNIFMVKFFGIDFIIMLTSRSVHGPGTGFWERIDLIHPLYWWTLAALFWIQVSVTAYYVTLYRKKPSRQAE